MARGEETDEELEFREENERQIALMIVASLWQSQWIRGALQTYEYHGKGFDGYRQMFGRTPPDSQRPSIPGMKIDDAYKFSAALRINDNIHFVPPPVRKIELRHQRSRSCTNNHRLANRNSFGFRVGDESFRQPTDRQNT
jgi:hypothetical protein